jgi:FtsP/CotA-like multicopper oxidase with cupredoxin domain
MIRVLLGASALSGALVAASPAPVPIPVSDLPIVTHNDNVESAGRMVDGVLNVELEADWAMWHPLGQDEHGLPAVAFREARGGPMVPGPMIRGEVGTRVHVTVRNRTDSLLVVRGLAGRTTIMDSLVVAPGAEAETAFTLDAAGTYYYWGTTTGRTRIGSIVEDAGLVGALVVDEPGADTSDRVMVMNIWIPLETPDGNADFSSEMLTINGRPWPFTERLRYQMGEEIRWRIINASGRGHPMHLHGFFFTVEARGDMARDTLYWEGEKRDAVTERMTRGSTMTMSWTPDRPGGWIFHCHISFHVMANGNLNPDNRPPPQQAFQEKALQLHPDHDPMKHVEQGMGGLMMSIYVEPPEGYVMNEPMRRQLRLHVTRDSVPDEFLPTYAFVLEEDGTPPARDSLHLPGSTLVMWRGEPTAVMVLNRMDETTQVHWHGLEIESYFDGVVGVGGYPTMPTPPVLPGDSFEMRITPPRAGSFMYHTHVMDIRQQSRGLYGPIVILDSGEVWDPEHDRVYILGQHLGDGLYLNGSKEPPPTTMTLGETYRLRFMDITVAPAVEFVLVNDDGDVQFWRAVAKDGFDLPAHQRTVQRAEQRIDVGETIDFEYSPRRPGEYALQVRRPSGRLIMQQTITVPDPDADNESAGGEDAG